MLLSTPTSTAFPSLPFPDHHRAKHPISTIAPSICPLPIRLSRSPDGYHRAAVAVSSATEAAVEALDAVEEAKEKLEVAVKVQEKPRLVLKFIWMEKNIGLALDQAVPGHGTIPLSPYYFWPRKDAWEELKTLLESKPWISQKRMIILLNQATDIINLWQQSGGGL